MRNPRLNHREKQQLVNFRCPACRYTFASQPDRIDDAPERNHPYLYFATCSECGEEADQASWEKAMMASFGRHTGPKTHEGKAAVTANIAGHPTPEEALRTRFNALKHGMDAKVATYFPAKPGKYPACANCEHLHGECWNQTACLKKTELFMRHHIAFDSGDPRMLTEIRADLHARITSIIDDITLAIIQRGVEIETPQWYYDKDGEFHLAQYTNSDGEKVLLTEVKSNPLLKVLTEYVSKIGLGLSDMGMTPKVQEENDLVRGHLDAEKADKETLADHSSKQTQLLEQLSEQIKRSQDRTSRDPVLIEHHEANGDG